MVSKNVLLLMVLGLMCLVEGDDPTEAMPCVKKLIPCQPYLHVPEKAPGSCCLPLKQMVSNDTKCLCGLFNNADMLKKLNLTRDEALKLPKACGADADISICNKDARSPPKSPVTPSPPSVRTLVLPLKVQPIHTLILKHLHCCVGPSYFSSSRILDRFTYQV